MSNSLFDVDYDKPFIRYMGGKQYARKQILSYAPTNLKHMVSPFIGGGSVELYAATRGIRVQAYDNLYALVRHWNIMLERAGDVMRAANKIFPVHRRILKDLIVSEKIHDLSIFPSPEKDLAFAALAMCMTRQGFNGYYMKTSYFRGLYDPKDHDLNNPEDVKRIAKDKKTLDRFDPWDEEYWDNWGNSNLTVEHQDWEITLAKHKHDFIFADPPYLGLEGYYGQYETRDTKYKQEPFNHEHLAQEILAHKNGAIVTYQDDEKGMIRSLYQDLEIIDEGWHQGSRRSQGSDNAVELIILKPPAMTKEERAKLSGNIGNPNNISRLYGMYNYLERPENERPASLCDWLEERFSCTHPEHPPGISMESIFRTVDYKKYSCTKSDVRGIIEAMVKRGIIVKNTNNYSLTLYGYPAFKAQSNGSFDMNKHILDMRKEGIPVKAIPHFSYKYDETA